MGIDDLIKQIEEDELADAAELGTMKPTRYAKLRGLYPQQIYAAIRNNKLKSSICACGSKVINVEEADILFRVKNEDGSPSD